MKRFISVVLVVAVAQALMGPAGAAPTKLKTELLSVSQVPKGFLVEAASSTEVFGCSASAFPTGSSAKATGGFNYKAPKAFPLIAEVLATFKNVTTAYGTLTGGIAGCAHVSGTQDGRSFTGTVSKLSLPSYGDQSAAYIGHVTFGGQLIVLDIVVVRRGKDLMELEEANFSSLSASGFATIAAAAANKI